MYSMYYKTNCVYVIVICIAQSTHVQASSVVGDQVLAAALLAPDVYRGWGFNWENTTLYMRYMYKSIYKYIKVFKVYEKSI